MRSSNFSARAAPPRRWAIPPFDAGGKDGAGGSRQQQAAIGRRRLLAVAAPVVCCGCPSCRPRNSWMDRSFAEAMSGGMADYELAIAPVKRQLFGQLLGSLRAGGSAGAADACSEAASSASQPSTPTVLDVGIGAGPNLPYYRRSGRNVNIVGVDPNPFMRSHLEASAARAAQLVTWVQGQAESLPLADGSVDAAVCTLVLCSVSDVAAVVAEVRRVLRPGGQLLFIEHTRAPADASLKLRLSQWAFNPLQQLLADGCHLDRDPMPDIQAGGFSAVEAWRFEVEGMGLIGPHVAGIATV